MYVSYSTKPFFFKESNFGYTVMVNYHGFDMTKQETGNDHFADFGIAQWDPIGIQFFYASPRVYGDGYDARVAGASLYATYPFNF